MSIELTEFRRVLGYFAISVTIVLVTHSRQEAVFLGDRVLVMPASPTHMREIVDTSQAEDFTSPAFVKVSEHLR